jgi:hypothetical protein
MMLGREELQARIAEIPAIKRGMVWCTSCGHSRRVDGGNAMRFGWPKCCGYTMTIDSPEERTASRFPGGNI